MNQTQTFSNKEKMKTFLQSTVLVARNYVLNRTSASSIYDALRPASFSAMIVGGMPLNASSKKFENSKLVLLWNLLLATTYVVFGAFHLFDSSIAPSPDKSITYKILLRGVQFVSTLYVFVVFITGYSLKNKVKR